MFILYMYFGIRFNDLISRLGQNDKNAQAKTKKKKMTDEEILSRLSKNPSSVLKDILSI